jgi:radical SAM-linked protein
VNTQHVQTEFRFRILYTIVGRLRFLSHKELMRVMARAFRRARLPLAYSRGFHPHPLISFGPPRPVGLAGTAELLDIRLTEHWSPEQIADAAGPELPPGIVVKQVTPVDLKAKAVTASVASARYAFEWPNMSPAPQDAARDILARKEITWFRTTGKGTRQVDLRPGIIDMSYEPPCVVMQLALSPQMHVRPQEVLSEMTGWTDDTIRRIAITRTGFCFTPIDAGSIPENYAERDNHRHGTETGTQSCDPGRQVN